MTSAVGCDDIEVKRSIWLGCTPKETAVPSLVKAEMGDASLAKAEINEDKTEPAGVFRSGENQEVHIHGQAGVTVIGHGMSAAEGELDLVVVQETEELLQVTTKWAGRGHGTALRRMAKTGCIGRASGQASSRK